MTTYWVPTNHEKEKTRRAHELSAFFCSPRHEMTSTPPACSSYGLRVVSVLVSVVTVPSRL